MQMNDKDLAQKLAELVAERGGRAYFVGGHVRDRLRGIENKDIDIEVHGLYSKQLEEVLDQIGDRMTIGESFGIYGLKGRHLDVALPRKEEKRGLGHKDFDILVDPFIGTYKAALRRDFTINALYEDVLTGQVIDHFGGLEDLEKGLIHHVNEVTFAEDPLRVLRAAQFAARFGFEVAAETVDLCRTIDLTFLSKERVMGELEKALLKAKKPSVFFEDLREMGQLTTWFPELEGTIGVIQDPRFHAEGDVWTHTMMVLDQAAQYRSKAMDPLSFMLSALVHDFGKPLCTEVIDGKVHSYRHELVGLPLVEAFMARLTSEKALARYALNMTELHMKPNVEAWVKASVKSTNRMFDRSVDPDALILLALCDDSGRISQVNQGTNEDFLRERLQIFREYMDRPHVMGRDLIEAGLKPSEKFSEYLDLAHKLRLAGIDKENALRQVLGLARKEGEYEG